MSLLDLLRTALRSVSANKLRAALTMLGVVIGVASVIAMLALGNGAAPRWMPRFNHLAQIKFKSVSALPWRMVSSNPPGKP